MSRQGGFHITQLIITLAVIGLVGFLGYTAWNMFFNTWSPDSKLTSNSQLDSAIKLLDDTKIDDDEVKHLDAELKF